MARRLLCCSLAVCALACAPTTRVVRGWSAWSTDQTDVIQRGPGHFGGRWTNHAIDILEPGLKGEKILVCTESGAFDGVWIDPYTVSACTNRSTKVCKHPEGTMTFECAMTCRVGPEGLLVFEGGASLVGATGRFEGVQARTTFTAWQVVPGPHDYGYTEMRVEMTTPRR